jgi:hypothetical protein
MSTIALMLKIPVGGRNLPALHKPSRSQSETVTPDKFIIPGIEAPESKARIISRGLGEPLGRSP